MRISNYFYSLTNVNNLTRKPFIYFFSSYNNDDDNDNRKLKSIELEFVFSCCDAIDLVPLSDRKM